MAINAWFTENDKIALSATGKVKICEDCPCGICGSCESSYLVQDILAGGLISDVIVTFVTGTRVCSGIASIANADCVWQGFSTGGICGVGALVSILKPAGVGVSQVFITNPSPSCATCSGPGSNNQITPAACPVGTYTGGSSGFLVS